MNMAPNTMRQIKKYCSLQKVEYCLKLLGKLLVSLWGPYVISYKTRIEADPLLNDLI